MDLKLTGRVALVTGGGRDVGREIALALTGANGAGLVPFGTEAGIFQAMGMQAVICGPGSIEQAHKPDEFIALEQLAEGIRFLERLGDRLQVAP